MPKLPRRHGFWNSYEEQRHLGLGVPLGFNDRMAQTMYGAMRSCSTWDIEDNGLTGGIFNLEFSPDGSLLVAACEQKSVLIFDPLQRKLIRDISNAHSDCVNCVRFLDDRIFATCSDDTTVALWDARNMKHKIRVLRGHSNWVKNIEYYKRDGILVTSGFDGSIYTWDMNNYPEKDEQYRRVFYTGKLMRTRLVPDMTKLVLCTSSGYVMIIHDLDLEYLDDDLAGFKPNLYRLMQISGTQLELAAAYTHLFHRRRRRNRVELITDFPAEDDAELISSLQVHPQGWCILSRNSSSSEVTEWSCIHDIQDKEMSEKEKEEEEEEEEEESAMESPLASGPSRRREENPTSVQVTSSDVWEALQTIYEERNRQRQGENRQRQGENRQRPGYRRAVDLAPPRNRHTAFILHTQERMLLIERSNRASENPRRVPPGHKIHRNANRLTHYIEEPNVGPGFIKEQCFSPDGRIIVSPYGYGYRILAFNESCSDLSTCVPDKPKPLTEIVQHTSHSSHVLSTRFSPTHHLLVTGCLGGKVVWHQPCF